MNFVNSSPTYSGEYQFDKTDDLAEEIEYNDSFLDGRLVVPETDKIRESALQQFYSALELIPKDAQCSYANACEKCPLLIETESNPILFLRYERFNPWAAVCRFVKYWEWRRFIFGAHRAYLPLLDLSGISGALTVEDIAFLETGVSTPIRRSQGSPRQVLFVNRTLNVDGQSKRSIETSLRIPFFFFTYFMNQIDAPKSFLIMDLFKTMPRAPIGLTTLQMAREGFPFTFEPILLVVPYANRITYYKLLLPMVLARFKNNFSPCNIKAQVGDSRHGFRQLFHDEGLDLSNMPESVGGSYSCHAFSEWLQMIRNRLADDSFDYCHSKLGKCGTTLPSRNCLPMHKVMNNGKYKDQATSPPLIQEHHHLIQGSIEDDNEDDDDGEDDMSNTSTNSSPDSVLELSEKIERAVKFIPWIQRRVYMDAIEMVPELVQSESDPSIFIDFFSSANNNIDAGSRLLASYWAKRYELFGDTDTFLPITNDGYFPAKFANMSKRCYVFNSYRLGDEKGCPMLYFDLSFQINSEFTKEEQECWIFCQLTKLMQLQKEGNGSRLFLVLDETKLELALSQVLLKNLRSVFPINFVSVHTVALNDVHQEHALRHPKVAACILSAIVGRSGKALTIYFGDISQNVSGLLAEFGAKQMVDYTITGNLCPSSTIEEKDKLERVINKRTLANVSTDLIPYKKTLQGYNELQAQNRENNKQLRMQKQKIDIPEHRRGGQIKFDQKLHQIVWDTYNCYFS